MALRSVLEYKIRGELKHYHVLMNVERLLASTDSWSDDDWRVGRPCMLSSLDSKYGDKYGKSLSDTVGELWGMSIADWARIFDFYESTEVNGCDAITFRPQISDIVIDCWNGDGEARSFSEINPLRMGSARDWNKCPICGQMNTYFGLKYELVCAADAENLEKWCKNCICFGSPYDRSEDVARHIFKRCRTCVSIDCPFAWKVADKNGGSNRKVSVGAVDFVDPGSALRRFCNKYNNEESLQNLANSIEEEDWGNGYAVLRNYLDFTFYNQMNGRSTRGGLQCRGGYAWFNTGLLTHDKLEDVYMCFYDGSSGHHDFLGFSWPSNPNGLYRKFERDVGLIPQYIPYANSPQDLIWDDSLWDEGFSLDEEHFDHIFFDNYDRFVNCRSFSQGKCGFDLVDVDLNWLKQLPKDNRRRIFVSTSDEHSKYFSNVQSLFRNSINQARKKAVRNFKWVLPTFFPRNRSMSLGLPLFLTTTGTGTVPDIVLLCVRQLKVDVSGVRAWRYQARTILRNDQLYTNSRQVCKPYCEWLSQLLRIEKHKFSPIKVGSSCDKLFVLPQTSGGLAEFGESFDERFGGWSRFDKQQGVICSFAVGAAFGWIRSDKGRKYRFNASDIEAGHKIKPGDYVQYDIVRRGRFLNAKNVSRIV